jgi:hypothetical protein
MVHYSYSLSVYIHNGVRGQSCDGQEVDEFGQSGQNPVTMWAHARCHRAHVRTKTSVQVSAVGCRIDHRALFSNPEGKFGKNSLDE